MRARLRRARYRLGQFWRALTAIPDPDLLAQAGRWLSPSLMEVFLRQQPGEQAHSLEIFRQLRSQGESDPHLLAAALLHDAGKTCCPLHAWERAVIVLGQALFPRRVAAWGGGEPRGWRRPFVVAQQHPAWGADLAAQAGASPLAVALIRRHQERAGGPGLTGEASLLLKLQLVDDEN